MDLNNIVGFKAIVADGNEQNVTVDEMVDMVSTRMVMALSETSTFAAAAATGNDVYENELPTVTDAANVRVLQSSGDAAQMTMQSLATKLGELIGVATAKKDGLMSMKQFFDRDVNPIEDYNTFTWNGIRKTNKSTLNSPFPDGDGQNAVIFIGTDNSQKIGLQVTYSGKLIKIRLYWVGSWGSWQTVSLT